LLRRLFLFATILLCAGLTQVAFAQSQSYTFTTLAGLSDGVADGPGAGVRFQSEHAIAVGADGIVYVSDFCAIRKVTVSGDIVTLAGQIGGCGFADGFGSVARFNEVTGIAVDRSGSLYVADNGNSVIRKITPSGMVTTFAGSPGTFGLVDGYGAAARF